MREHKHQKLRSGSIDRDGIDNDKEKSDTVKSYVSLKSKDFLKFILFQMLWIGPWIAGTVKKFIFVLCITDICYNYKNNGRL